MGRVCSKMGEVLLSVSQIAEFLHWLYLKNKLMNEFEFLHGDINLENVKVELIIRLWILPKKG